MGTPREQRCTWPASCSPTLDFGKLPCRWKREDVGAALKIVAAPEEHRHCPSVGSAAMSPSVATCTSLLGFTSSPTKDLIGLPAKALLAAAAFTEPHAPSGGMAGARCSQQSVRRGPFPPPSDTSQATARKASQWPQTSRGSGEGTLRRHPPDAARRFAALRKLDKAAETRPLLPDRRDSGN